MALPFLDQATLQTIYTLAGIVGPAVTATFFVTKRIYSKPERNQQEQFATAPPSSTEENETITLNDLARQYVDYIKCIREMKEDCADEFMDDSTSDEDKIFYKRLNTKLEVYQKKYQNQLNDILERFTKKRQ